MLKKRRVSSIDYSQYAMPGDTTWHVVHESTSSKISIHRQNTVTIPGVPGAGEKDLD